MWNPAVSNVKEAEFDKWASDWRGPSQLTVDWSVWDHEEVSLGDRAFMVRVGQGNTGVVFEGDICMSPYRDEDWSGRKRETWYAPVAIDFILPCDSPLILPTARLQEAIPSFNWTGGHSGRLLTDEQAAQMSELWQQYIKEFAEKN